MSAPLSARILRLVIQATAPEPLAALGYTDAIRRRSLSSAELLEMLASAPVPAAVEWSWRGDDVAIRVTPAQGAVPAADPMALGLPADATAGPWLFLGAGRYLRVTASDLARFVEDFPGCAVPVSMAGSVSDPWARSLDLPAPELREVQWVALLGGATHQQSDGGTAFRVSLRRGTGWQAG